MSELSHPRAVHKFFVSEILHSASAHPVTADPYHQVLRSIRHIHRSVRGIRWNLLVRHRGHVSGIVVQPHFSGTRLPSTNLRNSNDGKNHTRPKKQSGIHRRHRHHRDNRSEKAAQTINNSDNTNMGCLNNVDLELDPAICCSEEQDGYRFRAGAGV